MVGYATRGFQLAVLADTTATAPDVLAERPAPRSRPTTVPPGPEESVWAAPRPFGPQGQNAWRSTMEPEYAHGSERVDREQSWSIPHWILPESDSAVERIPSQNSEIRTVLRRERTKLN